MNIALLGADPATLQLATAAQAMPGVRVAAVADLPSNQPLPAALALAEPIDWETLIDNRSIDAVIVGPAADRERRADQLRKLTQCGQSLLMIHPVCESLVGHELEMIRRDTGARLTPYVPGARHPALGELAALFDLPAPQHDEARRSADEAPTAEIVAEAPGSGKAALGTLEQLLFTRRMSDRSPAAVTDQLARDLLLLQSLVGELSGISAVGPVDATVSFANLSAHLTGRRPVLVRWSVEPAEAETSAQLVAIGARGKRVLEIVEDLSRWRLRQESADATEETVISDPHAAEVAMAELSNAETAAGAQRWTAACRAQELAEAVPESLRRRRTITLYFDEHTEEGTFKGVMAVGGCAILMIVFLVTIFAAIVDGLQLPVVAVNSLLRAAPLCLLIPLVIFLLVQLLIIRPISGPKR